MKKAITATAIAIAIFLKFNSSIQAAETSNYETVKEAQTTTPVMAKKDRLWQTATNLTYYWDSREFNTFAILTSASGLPYGFSFWGFTDLHGNQDDTDDSFDHSRFFMEYRLSKVIDPDWIFGITGLGFQAEYNDANGLNNNLARFGLTFKHVVPSFTERKGWLQWRGFPIETDGDGGQASLIYFMPLYERLSLTGFADLNFSSGVSDRWVIEPALNFKISDQIWIVMEFRYNGFEDAAQGKDGKGLAGGFRVDF